MKKKFSGKQILILAACVLLVASVAITFLIFGRNLSTSGPTMFAIKELPSDEVKLSEKTITLETKCDNKDVQITWSCSNENKATVKDGEVALHEAGIVIVKAEVVGTNLSDEIIISIVNDKTEPATGVEIVNKPTETILFEEQTIYLSHQLLPDNAIYEEVIYTSSDESIAKVDGAGKVTIVAPGTVDIRVALESNAEIYDECTLDIAWDRVLSDDGTFEGRKGPISLYSPSVTDEIKNEQYKFQNPITFKKIKKNDGTSALSVVSEGEAWDTLFVKFDQKIKKGETYLISYNADWKANKVPTLYGYAIIPDTGNWIAEEPDNIVNFSTDVKWYDGMVQIPFTANADMNHLYLVLVNQDSNVNMNILMDNIRLTSADGVVLPSAVYNDDGTFEGKPGKFSVLSAHALELGAEGYGWSSKVIFDKVKNGNGNAIKVTSSGEHNIDYLYIKVDTPIRKNYKYAVSMDLEALDKQCKNGNYGYWILSPEANVENYVQFFQELNNDDLFKENATFEFVSNGEHDYFYLVLREYTLEDSGETDSKFNFKLDNIKFKEIGYMGDTSYLNDDGTFEGVSGNISFYSPTVTTEIKKDTYHSYNPILFKQIEKKDGTHALSIESMGSNWDTLFMKFDIPIKRGTTYEITYDANWNGEKEPTTYGYAVMPSTENWVTDEVSNMVNYASDIAWYDGQVKIRFTANADVEKWYLTLVVQDADVALNMDIDNIHVENVGAGAVYDDNGTFEGVNGIYSLLSPHDIDGAFGFGWAPTLTFKEMTNNQGTKYAVTSSGDNEMDLLYIKVNKKIKQDGKYTVTMDLEPLDNGQTTGSWYYWICSPDAVVETGNGKAVIQEAQNVASNKFFKEDSTFTFTANADYDYFYILICENGASGGHVPFNFSIDNIEIESDESAVKPTDESKFVKEVALQGNGPTYSLTNLEPGTKYKLTVNAVGSPSVVVSNNKNGAVYDGVSFYTKTKLITADKDVDGNPTGTYSVVFETAAVDFDEVTLSISGTYSNPTLYEESRVEIKNIPTKNQLAVGKTCDLDTVLIGLDNAGAVTWKSSDTAVATIGADGVVTAKKVGKTEITATVTEDGEKYEAYVELYVINASLGANAYGLIMDTSSPTDFTLQIPANEEIRVMQISDTQIIYPYDLRYEGILSESEIKRWGGENALNEHCFVYMEKSFEILEKSGKLPHLVVLAGDNIYGQFDDDGAMLDALIAKMDELCEEYGIYWTFVFGNHDKESDIGIEAILRKYSNSAYCLYAYRNVSGDSNMSVAIKQDNEYKQIVYMFDTHNTGSASGTNQKGNRVDEYATLLAGIYDSQIEWFQSVANTYKNVPSLVYMHIAFEEYARTFAGHGYDVTYDQITQSSADVVVPKNNTYGDFGELHERVSIWDDNAEKEGTDFYQMLTGYNVKGVFCGHNHKNNYSVVTEDDIRLTFGLKSSTYDAYHEGFLGGTLVTTDATQMDVAHIYAVAKMSESILNDDGTFEGNTGKISLYSAKDVSTAYGSGWANDLTFEQTIGLSNNYVTVRSAGEHSYDNLFVKFNQELKAGKTYQIHMELTALDDVQKELSWYYWLTDETGTITSNLIQDATNLQSTVLFDKDGVTITFKADKDRDSFGMILVDNGTAGKNFNFTLDNVSVGEKPYDISEAILKDDGTFEGKIGNISLYSPKASAVTSITYNDFNPISFQKADTSKGTVLTAKSTGTGWDAIFIKFDESIVKGNEYTITYDATWKGATKPTVYGYSIMPSHLNWLAAEDNMAKFDGSVVWFDGKVTITFTANANLNTWYLVLADQNGDVPLDIEIDNIKVKEKGLSYEASESVLKDNGTFEGVVGNISLYSPKASAVTSITYNDFNPIIFKGVSTANGKAISATSTGTGWDAIFIKFDEPIVNGKQYAITYNATWKGASKPTVYGYSIMPSHLNWLAAEDNMAKFDGSVAWFDGKVTITFTANANLNTWYLVLADQNGDVPLNIEIDNIKVSEK